MNKLGGIALGVAVFGAILGDIAEAGPYRGLFVAALIAGCAVLAAILFFQWFVGGKLPTMEPPEEEWLDKPFLSEEVELRLQLGERPLPYPEGDLSATAEEDDIEQARRMPDDPAGDSSKEE